MIGKLVAVAIAPLGTSLGLGLLAACLLLTGRPVAVRWGRRCASAAWLWLGVWSLPAVSETLRGAIEARAGERVLERLPPASAAVVLGGGVRGPRAPLRPDPDLGSSADRLWYAARLYHAGKVPLLVVSGGVVRTGDGTEADTITRVLRDLGVPASAIVQEGISDDTMSNVAQTVQLLRTRGLERPLLVTSALHMPRARVQFERAGLAVTPAPTDFEVIDQPWHILQWLPSGDALEGSGRAFKELLGRWIDG